MNPRTRALITVGLVITILTLFFLFIFVRQQNKDFSDTVQKEQYSLQKQIDLLIEQTTQRYRSRIKSLVTNRVQIIRSFSQKDRKELLKQSSPLLKLFKKEDSYFHGFFFANPDNTIFLRVGAPELYGDDVTLLSPLVAEVNRFKKIMSGFEITKSGLSYRILNPIFVGEDYIGLIGFIINEDLFLDQLHQTSNACAWHHNDRQKKNDIALVFPKAEIDKAVFLNKPYRVIGDYVIFSDSTSHFQELPDNIDLDQKVQLLKFHGKSHALVQTGDFKNFKGDGIAMGFSLMDIESIVSETKRTIVLTVLFSFSLLFFSFIIIYFNFNILFKKITELNHSLTKSNKELEHRVEERTADLQKEITERKGVEISLINSEKKYRSMMESMKDLVYICSPDYRIEYMNPAMIKRMGENALGEYCFKALHNFDQKCPWCKQNKMLENVYFEMEINSPKDNCSYHVSISPVVHENGSVSKMIILRDTTDLKKMELQLQQAQKMESIGTLAGGIAHDFNNILFPIVGHAEMILTDTPEDSQIRESLNQIYTSALRAKELVKQILTFSRQDSNEFRLMKMQPIVKEALKLIRSTIPTTIEIRQDINPDCGVIKADPTQIHQIVMNLATNAYHAMEETGGELNVSLKQLELGEDDIVTPGMTSGVYVCLTIADTGVGMDKIVTDKIFDPFFTTKAIGKGTGMGLSVVHGIVTAMEGAINVYSELGKGTEFHVYLPVEKTLSKEQATTSKAKIQGGTEQILLVDDEEPILSIGKRMLERLGYQVTSRSSSLEALEAFRDSPDKFDLVITDMAMPNMPGDKLSVELTKIRPDIPVLLCTGFSETMSEEKGSSIGIKGFLLKPIVMKDLAQKIREVLE